MDSRAGNKKEWKWPWTPFRKEKSLPCRESNCPTRTLVTITTLHLLHIYPRPADVVGGLCVSRNYFSAC